MGYSAFNRSDRNGRFVSLHLIQKAERAANLFVFGFMSSQVAVAIVSTRTNYSVTTPVIVPLSNAAEPSGKTKREREKKRVM